MKIVAQLHLPANLTQNRAHFIPDHIWTT